MQLRLGEGGLTPKSLPLGGKVAPQGRMRGELAATGRKRVIVARLPLISQRPRPLTASPKGEATDCRKSPLCQQAMDLNFDGLIVESHCNPDCAWSDASQQVTPDVLDYILNLLVIRTETQTTESLSQLRKQIDECDDNIIQELAKRMRIAREIGTYKKEHGITVLQAGRYNEILEKRGAQGEQCGMDAEFMKKIFEAIHEESVRQQMEIINK